MTKTSQSVVETFVDLIEDNVTDVNSERLAKSKKWVYDDIPRLDIRDYPRVGVISPTAISVPHEINSTRQRFSPRIEVQVRVKKGMTLTIDAQSMRDVQILDYVCKKITDFLATISSRAQLLSNDSVFYTELESENTIYGDLIIIRQLVYKNTLVR